MKNLSNGRFELKKALKYQKERKSQTITIICLSLLFLFGSPTFVLTLFILFFSPLFFLTWGYLIFLYFDWNQQNRGGRSEKLVKWTRNLKIWTKFSSYFPITLEKTAELDPSKNYLLAFHPHGIFPVGAFANFATEATGFSKLFPGIRSTLLSLNMFHMLPFLREVVLALGVCSVNSSSLEYLLTKRGKGNAIIILVGGASEILDAVPNTMKLVLKTRKGFVKYAMKHGASLVPVISFGENEVYQQHDRNENSIIYKSQKMFQSYTTFPIPLFYGRGIFPLKYGHLPYRQPIHSIVGKPLEIVHIENPTQEEIDNLHTKYCGELQSLFDKYKNKYGYEDLKLIFK